MLEKMTELGRKLGRNIKIIYHRIIQHDSPPPENQLPNDISAENNIDNDVYSNEVTAQVILGTLEKYIKGEEIDLIRYGASVTHPTSITNELFIRNNYDFIGWCIEDPLVNPDAETVLIYDSTLSGENSEKYVTTNTWNNLQFTDSISMITLYAKYKIHAHNVTFYIEGEPTII